MALLDTTWYANYGNGSTTGYYGVTQFAVSTAYSVGQIIRQLTTPSVGNERCFIVVVGGTSAGSEPTWTVTRGAKTTSNTVTFQECTGQPALCGDAANTVSWTTLKANTTAATLGQVVKDAAGTHAFICTTAGTISGSEPSWNTSAVGNTTTDTSATWTYLGSISGFSAWGAPHARIANACASNWLSPTVPTTIFVGDNHAEVQSTTITIQAYSIAALLLSIICVDHTVTPPTSSSLRTTATVNTNAANAHIYFQSNIYCYGITFNAGTSTGTAAILIPSSGGGYVHLESCTINLSNSSGSSYISLGGSGYARIRWTNCSASFGHTSQTIYPPGGMFTWKGGSLSGATIPTTMFTNSSYAGPIYIEGVDLSALVTGKCLYYYISGTTLESIILKDCKLSSTFTVFQGTVTRLTSQVRIIHSDPSSYNRTEFYDALGILTTDSVLYRTGGFSDAAAGASFNITTSALATWAQPFDPDPIVQQNPTTGSSVNAVIRGIWNAAALPNNDDIWMDVEYFGDASSPQGSIKTSTKANILASGSALSASTSAWDSGVTARANSTSYSLGNMIKLASNSGRVFFCTTAGTSAGSEPGGYATAVDGGSVTDGSAVFRAGVRFKITVTLSSPYPQKAGYNYHYVRVAKASSTFWIDPLIATS